MRTFGRIAAALAVVLAGCTGGGEPEPSPASPTPAVTFERWQSRNAVEAFQTASLEVGGARAMTRDDYGMAPYVAAEGTRFLIPSLGEDAGGRIMSFASPEGLYQTKAYYDDLGKNSAAFFSWTFVRDNILVQLNGELPETRARAYESALAQMR